jgi:nucleotide-binding universal stress UspA family protein
MFTKILVGLDGSEAARHALARALDLAAIMSAGVHLVSVEERLPAYAATVGEVQDEQRYENQYYRQLHIEAEHLAAQKEVPITHEIVPGHAAHTLVQKAKQGGFDLIVVGHTGHSRLHNVFLGSTADRVVEHAACAVLVVR